MLSFSKILLLIVVILGVLIVFRGLGAIRGGKRARMKREREDPALDLQRCDVCGVYAAGENQPCDRADCPRGARP